MRPQDIEKIANSVMGAFSRPTRASAGCTGVSDPQEFECIEYYNCQSDYECGGVATFRCAVEGFACQEFFCQTGPFDCVIGFGCTTYSY